MIRIALVAIGTFLVGILLASIINSTDMTQLQNEYDEKIARLTQELADTHASLSDALEIPERTTEPMPPPATIAEPLEEIAVTIEEQMEIEPAATGLAEEAEAVQERPDRGDRRRQSAEQFQEMRNRYMGMMDEYWENADPETQERITAMVEYQEEIFQLGQEMRNAETDEDRMVIRGSMGETMENLRKTIQKQQNAMIGQVVGEYGITGSKRQKEFTQAIRDVISNPLFNAGGFGRGGFGGGNPRRGGIPGGGGFPTGGRRGGRDSDGGTGGNVNRGATQQ